MPLALRVPTPMMVDPFRKATVPVGIVLPVCGATFAVKVTFCPVLICVADEVSEVVVATSPWVAVMVTGEETELELVVLPP
jgi:hypothetical protein